MTHDPRAREVIAQMLDDVKRTPFFFRRALDKSCFEVGRLLNDDWQDVMPDNDQIEIIATDLFEWEAKEHHAELVDGWRAGQVLDHLTSAGIDTYDTRTHRVVAAEPSEADVERVAHAIFTCGLDATYRNQARAAIAAFLAQGGGDAKDV